MSSKTNTEIVNKLIGRISPVGETNEDNERFDNLKSMCELLEQLFIEVAALKSYQNSNQFSVKRAGDYAATCIDNLKNL